MKKKLIIILTTAALSGFTYVLASQVEQPIRDAQETEARADNEDQKEYQGKTILFFINPHGKPCQIQDGILKEMALVRDGMVKLEYIYTTVPEDRQSFYKYGIRALPALIVLNADRTIYHRFSPGIQSSETIAKIIEQK